MASSLEKLLAEEGFKGRRSPRTSFGLESFSMPLYSPREHRKSESTLSSTIKTERARSNVSRYSLRGELSTSCSVRNRRSRDNLVKKGKLDEGSYKETRDGFEGRGSNGVIEGKKIGDDSLENDVFEVGTEENEGFKDIYSNEGYNSESGRDNFCSDSGKKERYKEGPGKDIKVDRRHSNISNKHLIGRTSFGDDNRKSIKLSGTSYENSNRNSWNSRNLEAKQSQTHDVTAQGVSEPSLDEVAIQAMVSIISDHIKSFLKDEDFRNLLRENSFSSLNFVELDEGHDTEHKVISNLEQAIGTVERAAEDSASAKDLKKASLHLSVIAGLNSNDLKDGFTSGVPNSQLSACAHVYLSVIYKLQKKEKVSAKHLLQVFCESPFQARKFLFPELWEYLFLPHLSHLEVWYNQESSSLSHTPSKLRKLKLLEKVYNEIMDSGTYQFAVYYKDWLTDGIEVPSIPSIRVPSVSVGKVEGGLHGHPLEVTGPVGPYSPQLMISRRLYDSVIGRSSKPGVDEVEVDEKEESFDNFMRSSNGSDVEDKKAIACSSVTGEHTDQDIEEGSTKNAQDNSSNLEDELLLTAEEGWTLHGMSAPGESVHNDEVGDSYIWEEATKRSHMLHAPPYTEANELTLKRLAKSAFELQQTDSSTDFTVPSLPQFSEPTKMRPSVEDLCGNFEYINEGSFFSSIPQDFICPLTGQLFDDPVTLETGQTFERVAIMEWFDQGKKICPVTRKTLECLAVPLTNFVLKRVIDYWKLEHCKHLFALASQTSLSSGECGPKNETALLILEQLLTAFSKEERIAHAKHLISLGGLQFLMRMFEFGNVEEKTRVVALMFCFVEADADCRDKIAQSINKQSLLDLLHSKQVNERTNVVLLLTELICLKRRKDVMFFLSGLQNEGIMNTMHVLLVYLQSSPPEQRPLVAILLLHLDHLLEPRKYSIYRDEAADAIIVALDCSLIDEKVRVKCCRALLILGIHFSISRNVLTENQILEQEGYDDNYESDAFDKEKQGLLVDDFVPLDGKEHINKEWLRNLLASLLGNGKKSFLETISKCLGSGNLDLVRVCLITVAWLSCTLASLSEAEFQLFAFSALISRLKESLDNIDQIELRILASMSLLNFSKIPECRVLLMTIAEEIVVPLRGLAKITWTAKELYAIISGEDL